MFVQRWPSAWPRGRNPPHTPSPKVQKDHQAQYEFDFDVDGTLVLAISSRHQSTSAALHKLVDVKGTARQPGTQTMIVIDDRRDAKATVGKHDF